MTIDIVGCAQRHGRAMACIGYAKSLRNPHKRAYALAYGAWIEFGIDPKAPVVPALLGFMGAQAVRIEIGEIRKQWGAE